MPFAYIFMYLQMCNRLCFCEEKESYLSWMIRRLCVFRNDWSILCPQLIRKTFVFTIAHTISIMIDRCIDLSQIICKLEVFPSRLIHANISLFCETLHLSITIDPHTTFLHPNHNSTVSVMTQPTIPPTPLPSTAAPPHNHTDNGRNTLGTNRKPTTYSTYAQH